MTNKMTYVKALEIAMKAVEDKAYCHTESK